MESITNDSPLAVIVGQTASGKSALAMTLAQKFNGEIICADSRTVYRGMDIGTAKPTPEDRRKIRHHLLDIASPNHPITVADFKRLAEQAILDITSRGKLPILVGGTGLYIDSIVFGFSFRGEPDAQKRQELEKKSVGQLQDILRTEGIALPNNSRNPRHLIRQIETSGKITYSRIFRSNTLMLGLHVEDDELKARIEARVNAMLAAGLETEVRRLVESFGWNCRALQTIGYQEFKAYFDSAIGLDELRQIIVHHTVQYAKRQKTWFKRNKNIRWIYKTEESVDLITTLMNK